MYNIHISNQYFQYITVGLYSMHPTLYKCTYQHNKFIVLLISYNRFLECTLAQSMETIYLPLVHTGSLGNLSHEIPGISICYNVYYIFIIRFFQYFLSFTRIFFFPFIFSIFCIFLLNISFNFLNILYLSPKHGCELLADPLEDLLDGGGVPNKGRGHLKQNRIEYNRINVK